MLRPASPFCVARMGAEGGEFVAGENERAGKGKEAERNVNEHDTMRGSPDGITIHVEVKCRRHG